VYKHRYFALSYWWGENIEVATNKIHIDYEVDSKPKVEMDFQNSSLQSCYQEIMDRLGLLMQRLQHTSQSIVDDIFIDDVMLRLKLWAADVKVEEGSLEWAQTLEVIRRPLLDRLQDLKKQCNGLDDALDNFESTSTKTSKFSKANLQDVRDDFLRAVERLSTFVSALKAAQSIPKDERSHRFCFGLQ
jgi:hypothetical protein